MIIKPEDLPPELDIREKGFVMQGWDFSRVDMAAAISTGRMLNSTFEAMSNYCPWECNYCYTQRDASPEALKLRLATELPVSERLRIIREAKALGAKSMNFIGAGEPTLDKHFWEIVGCVASLGMVPLVFTEASFRLTEESFVRRLYELGATVVIKVNSLWNRDYQNSVVAGDSGTTHTEGYFERRNQAIELCLKTGFANHTPTRLAFDTIITRQNRSDMGELLRYRRNHNIFSVLKNFLRTGRAREARVDGLDALEQQELWNELAAIDESEFGLKHSARFPFGGSHPCTLRSTGVHISIEGQVFRCDGEEEPLGDLRAESLETIWTRVRHIDQNVLGYCPPRERHWAEATPGRRHLPVVQ